MQTSEDVTCRLRGCKNPPEEGKKRCRTCLNAEAARKHNARKKIYALTENNTQQTGSWTALGRKNPLNGQQRDIEEQESEVEEIPAPKHKHEWNVWYHISCLQGKRLTFKKDPQLFQTPHHFFSQLKHQFQSSNCVNFVRNYSIQPFDDLTPDDIANSISSRIYEVVGYRFTYVYVVGMLSVLILCMQG